MSGNLSKLAFFACGKLLLTNILDGKELYPPTIVSGQKTRIITLSCSVKISAVVFFVLSQSTRVTDGQTERQIYDFQDRASVAASRGRNH